MGGNGVRGWGREDERTRAGARSGNVHSNGPSSSKWLSNTGCVASGNAARSASSPLAKSAMSRTLASIDALAARSSSGAESVARAARRSANPVSPPSGGVACAWRIESKLCRGVTQNWPSWCQYAPNLCDGPFHVPLAQKLVIRWIAGWNGSCG